MDARAKRRRPKGERHSRESVPPQVFQLARSDLPKSGAFLYMLDRRTRTLVRQIGRAGDAANTCSGRTSRFGRRSEAEAPTVAALACLAVLSGVPRLRRYQHLAFTPALGGRCHGILDIFHAERTVDGRLQFSRNHQLRQLTVDPLLVLW